MSNLAYVASKIAHMNRIGIPAGTGPNGGASPDWQKIAQRDRMDNPPKVEPSKRKPRDITSGHFGAACQNALRQIAAADNSDPFAMVRLSTHLRNGIEDDPATVSVKCGVIIANRQAMIQKSYEDWKLRRVL